METKDYNKLRKKFAKHILKHWEPNNRCQYNIHCVYGIVLFDFSTPNSMDIAYIGSTTCLKSRWKSHKIPDKIKESGFLYSLFYIEMDTGFYDYEMKLIKKLKPFYNKQHKK